jgi:hypothetical protein
MSSTLRAPNFLKAALAVLPLALPVASATPALAVGQGPYSLEVLVDGRPLHELWGNGRSYVQAIAGREYSLRLTNNTGGRVAIALAVDGLNSIDAKTTTASDGSKWILGPYESITLDGWQTSSATARRFFFTTEAASYGAWLGKTSNLGVISAAVFRERVAVQPIQPMLQRQRSEDGSPGEADSGGASGELNAGVGNETAPLPPAAVPAPQEAPAGSEFGRDAESSAKRRSDSAPRSMPQPKDEYAATGIGRELDHRVDRVAFDAEPKPAASLEVRYEYRDALVKLGLLPPRGLDPLDRRERAHGFKDTQGYAPDPYNGHRP